MQAQASVRSAGPLRSSPPPAPGNALWHERSEQKTAAVPPGSISCGRRSSATGAACCGLQSGQLQIEHALPPKESPVPTAMHVISGGVLGRRRYCLAGQPHRSAGRLDAERQCGRFGLRGTQDPAAHPASELAARLRPAHPPRDQLDRTRGAGVGRRRCVVPLPVDRFRCRLWRRAVRERSATPSRRSLAGSTGWTVGGVSTASCGRAFPARSASFWTTTTFSRRSGASSMASRTLPTGRAGSSKRGGVSMRHSATGRP